MRRCDILQHITPSIRRVMPRVTLLECSWCLSSLQTGSLIRRRQQGHEKVPQKARVSQAGSIRTCLRVRELVSRLLQASSMPSTPTSQSAAPPMHSVSWQFCAWQLIGRTTPDYSAARVDVKEKFWSCESARLLSARFCLPDRGHARVRNEGFRAMRCEKF